jgi:hypothetical protein
METLLSICLGIGLSAACGFRVFVPLLVVGIASRAGHLQLAAGFDWMASDAALIAFGVATALEIAAYYVPWVDNLLDSIATPAAIVAGTIVTASVVTGMSPMLKWSLAVIAGGGAAGIIQGATVVARGASSVTTGGLANPIFATIELGGSVFVSILAIVLPLVALVVIVAAAFGLGRKFLRRATPVPPVISS